MRIFIIAILVCAFAYPVIAAERGGDDPETVKITLTTDQLTKVTDAGKKPVTVELTTEQIKVISAEFKTFKGKTMKVTTAQLRNNNMVKLTVDAAGEANPQPSP